jgi:hypothetical protein
LEHTRHDKMSDHVLKEGSSQPHEHAPDLKN